MNIEAIAHLKAYLGRREYPPTEPILLGVTDAPVAEAVRDHPWLAAAWYRREHAPDLRVRELVHVDQRGWSPRDGRRPAPSPRPFDESPDWFEVVSRP